MIISNSPERINKKSWEQYATDIDLVLKNCSRVLKKNKFCIFFMRPGRRYWMKVVNHFKLAARKYGLEPVHRIDVSKNDPSIRKIASATWANYTESIMIFYKPKDEYTYWFIDNEWIEKEIVELLTKEISKINDKKILISNATEKIGLMLRRKNLAQYMNETEKIMKVINRYYVFKDGYISLNNNSFFFNDFRKETIKSRIIDLIPELIETIFDEKQIFTYEELMLKISFYLDNGDKDAIQEFDKNRKLIKNILKQLTKETKAGFIRKTYNFEIKEGRKNLQSLSGTEFEDLIADILKNQGYYEILKIGGSGDRGVDIVCKIRKGDIEKKVAVQCKRWISNVGSTAIQRLHSYGIVENQDMLMCCTTAGFTSEGEYMAKNTNVTMIDGKKVLEWVEQAYPGKFYL